ncbi:phosphoglucosamine mutase [bacterium]|nr:phosphoglucosamine mutase [bacterium]
MKKKNIFGTDGVRAKVGQAPIDLEKTVQLGQAIALWAQSKYKNQPTALLANDTRESCSFLKAALKAGLLLHSTNIYDGQVLPTPAVFNIIQKKTNFDFGIVISASHNPYQYNGIKLIDAQSGKLSLQDEQEISSLFESLSTKQLTKNYHLLGFDITWQEARQNYVDSIVKQFDKNLLQNRTIVLDCAHGATYQVAPTIFEQLGAHVITIHNSPTGKNINLHCGSTEPQSLKQTVIKHNADIGFAFDGDGDRLTVVSDHGTIKDGDDILALLVNHPLYKKQHSIVGTIMTNQGFEKFLNANNKQLIRSSVGDKFVAQDLKKENLLLGGEPSGHIITNDYLSIGDGIFAALRVVESIIHNNNWKLKTFTKFPQVMTCIPVSEKKDLNSENLSNIIAASKAQLDSGRLIVRYSGTEPLLRVMVEEEDHKNAHRICTGLCEALQQELQ